MKHKEALQMKKVAIIGYGYVGKAMANFFQSHYEVIIYDPFIKESWSSASKDQVNVCDLAVICVPTNQRSDGRCDTSIVEYAISWIECPHILLKSTVPPGTTDSLQRQFMKNIVFSPEYCGESSYWTPYDFHTDIKETPFFIFGGNPEYTSKMVDFFIPITGPVKTYRQTTAREAELAKYMANCFFATKIVFCYEMARIAENKNIDFNEVRELWLLDPRINPMHTAVFANNQKPFGGKCLPKDLSALIKSAESNGYNAQFLKDVQASNERLGQLREHQE